MCGSLASLTTRLCPVALCSRADTVVLEGSDTIRPWLTERGIRVFDYSIRRADGVGRETFHAKVLLCDRHLAYIGSSNMTSASLEHSMEMGVVLEGHAAAIVAEVLDAVLAAATQVV